MRKTPEIPQDVFFEEETTQPKKKAVATKTATQQATKTVSSQKVQVTIYLSKQAAQDLEKARFELLAKHDLKVPKSLIAEHAIIQAAADIDSIAKALGAKT